MIYHRYRRVDSGPQGGRFCTRAYADRNPNTTEAEEVKVEGDSLFHSLQDRLNYILPEMFGAQAEDIAEWELEAHEVITAMGQLAKRNEIARMLGEVDGQ